MVAYNKGMSLIDRSDQMLSHYSTPGNLLKWYIKIFFHLVDVTLLNSVVIFSRLNRKMTYPANRDLITRHCIQVQPTECSRRTNTSSTIVYLPIKLAKILRCHVCRAVHKKRSESHVLFARTQKTAVWILYANLF